jgi:O-antigen/teichoic acid export membrane protein
VSESPFRLPSVRRSLLNISSAWVIQGANLVFALITVPIITRRFGIDGLGLWLLVQQVASHLQLIELGLPSSLGRFLARDVTHGKRADFARHLSSALFILICAAALLLLATYPVAWTFGRYFGVPEAMRGDAEMMMIIALTVTAVVLPMRSAIGVLGSQHRFYLVSAFDGGALIGRFVLVIAACTFATDHAFVLLAGAVFGPVVVSSAAMFSVALRRVPDGSVALSGLSRKACAELFDVSLSAMVVTLAAVLLRQTSPMLVGHQLGLDAVPLIALPLMVVTSVGPFLGIANQLIAPVASQLDAQGDRASLLDRYLVAARYTVCGGVFGLVMLILAMPTLLPLWLGRTSISPTQVGEMYVNLVVIYAAYCLALPALLGRSVLMAVGRHWNAARGELATVLAGVVIGLLLLTLADLGSIGMGVGIGSAYVMRAGGVLMRSLSNYFGVPAAQLYWRVWRAPLLVGLPMLAPAFLQHFVSSLDGGYRIVIGVAVIASIVLFWTRILVPEHRDVLLAGVWKGVRRSPRRMRP